MHGECGGGHGGGHGNSLAFSARHAKLRPSTLEPKQSTELTQEAFLFYLSTGFPQKRYEEEALLLLKIHSLTIMNSLPKRL